MTKTDKVVPVEHAPLDADDEDVYRRLVAREHMRPEDAPRVEKLRSHYLAEHEPHSPTQPVALDPRTAERRQLAKVHREIADKLDELHKMADTYARLEREYEQHHTGDAGVRVLPTAPQVNEAIGQAAARGTRAIFTAQPTKRDRKILEASYDRDAALLRRGVKLYTIYNLSARSRDGESKWAEDMSALGAEVRTCPVPFPRIVYIEGVAAYLEDLRGGPESKPAVEVSHPAVLAWVHSIYMYYWTLSQPWRGGRGPQPDSGELTSARGRTILRLLINDMSRKEISKKLDISERVISSELADMRIAFGVETDMALAIRWRESAEYDLT
ncbi:LuxR C-terminal-related transcriptional regulator [Streptomyces sp. NPDC005551]|uniref:LuxR C-terminal-related transcriptional regulator n=1 Tax=Streptomyces sp. NPDC005551 TaxID=3364725 RepID=UPI00368E8C76